MRATINCRKMCVHMHLAFRLWPAGLIALAAAIRLALISFGWPVLNSDEATMGLMASHIAYHAEHPAFLYGQSYMGALEAYLGAAIFRLLGSSAVALRLGAVLLYSLFLTSIYGWLASSTISKLLSSPFYCWLPGLNRCCMGKYKPLAGSKLWYLEPPHFS